MAEVKQGARFWEGGNSSDPNDITKADNWSPDIVLESVTTASLGGPISGVSANWVQSSVRSTMWYLDSQPQVVAFPKSLGLGADTLPQRAWSSSGNLPMTPLTIKSDPSNIDGTSQFAIGDVDSLGFDTVYIDMGSSSGPSVNWLVTDGLPLPVSSANLTHTGNHVRFGTVGSDYTGKLPVWDNNNIDPRNSDDFNPVTDVDVLKNLDKLSNEGIRSFKVLDSFVEKIGDPDTAGQEYFEVGWIAEAIDIGTPSEISAEFTSGPKRVNIRLTDADNSNSENGLSTATVTKVNKDKGRLGDPHVDLHFSGSADLDIGVTVEEGETGLGVVDQSNAWDVKSLTLNNDARIRLLGNGKITDTVDINAGSILINVGVNVNGDLVLHDRGVYRVYGAATHSKIDVKEKNGLVLYHSSGTLTNLILGGLLSTEGDARSKEFTNVEMLPGAQLLAKTDDPGSVALPNGILLNRSELAEVTIQIGVPTKIVKQ